MSSIKTARQGAIVVGEVMGQVIDYLKNTKVPTAEAAHELIDSYLADRGYESPEGHIVAAGEQAVEPHEHGTGLVSTGVPIVIDIFPRFIETGYWADMTRTVCLGKIDEPTDEVQKMFDTVLAAQELAINNVKPGITGGELHDLVWDYFKKTGYETGGQGAEFKYAHGFVHGLGHGVGQEIHQSPKISAGSKDVLKIGDVITIEPGLYYPGVGAVRIEDMVLVTETGCEVLTKFPKDFILK